jgi:glycosyltransferase involved in cell wall biosynthesis
MNILLLTPMPPQAQAPGAIPVLLHALVSALAQRHRVTLVTPLGSEREEQAALKGLTELGVTVHAAPLIPLGSWPRWERRLRLGGTWLAGRTPWRTCWFSAPQIQHILDDLLRQESFDIVHVEDNAMGVYRLRTQTPKLLTEHEVRRPRPIRRQRPPAVGWRQWVLGELDWQRWPDYQRRIWQQFDRIQVFTQRDAEAVRRLATGLTQRVSVNPFGVSLPAAARAEREDENLLFFVGNYTHAPNVDAALWLGHEIMPRLRQVRPGVRLALAGIYPPPAVLSLACADIAVLGPVAEIEPWLEQAALILAPLRIGGGMRMKVLQAMAMGKAVLTTARGAEGLALEGQAPPLALADDTDGIVAAAAALLAAPQQRRALGQQARAHVAQHFSPAAHLRRLESVYAELLARPRQVRKEMPVAAA